MANSVLVRRKVIESDYCREEVANVFKKFWKDYEDSPLDGRDHILASICPQV